MSLKRRLAALARRRMTSAAVSVAGTIVALQWLLLPGWLDIVTDLMLVGVVAGVAWAHDWLAGEES